MTEKSRKVNESQIDFLKPCPFCGSDNLDVLEDTTMHPPLWLIRHWDDDCILYGNSHRYSSKEQAIESWNKRVRE